MKTDFYAVISRAIAELGDSDVTVRRAVYEQAQAELMAELARCTPRPDPLQIDNEYRALNNAIRTVEAELSDARRADRISRSGQTLLKAIERVQSDIEAAKPSRFRGPPTPGREVAELVALLPD
jgi:hypothetical protein